MTVEFRAVSYVSSEGEPILADLSFTATGGEIFSVIGESGVGKTTILRLICGLEKPTMGEVLHNGIPVAGPGRSRGMVFQDYDAFEWMTVRRNVEFAQSLVTASGEGLRYDVDELLENVELNTEGGKFPSALSGGMRQRLAIVRALAAQPDVLCLDEPFSALDPLTKGEVREKIVEAATTHNTTLVIVSHDIPAAIVSCDSGIVVARRGNKPPARICTKFQGFRESYDGIVTDQMCNEEQRILDAMREEAKLDAAAGSRAPHSS